MFVGKFYSSLLSIFILTLLVAEGYPTLSVYNLQALGETNSKLLDIQYSIANFGFVPYGKTIIGRLMPSPNSSSQCELEQGQHKDIENSFLLIPRGQCQFVTKALNAQRLGAQMAIISDNQKHDKLVKMSDNDYGYKVKIPSIFINYEDGNLLEGLLKDHPDSAIMMKITFQNKKTEVANVTFWLQANNRHSYRLVEDFRKYYPLIKDQTKFQIVYSNIQCGIFCKKEDCYFSQKYCAKNVIHEESANGKLILDQQIREQITFELYPDAWWRYMKYFDEECSVISAYKQCGNVIMKKQGIDPSKIQSAFASSFSDDDNTYLKKNRKLLQNSGITKFPTVTINGNKIKGSLYAEFIFDDICNTLQQPPATCSKYIQTETTITEVKNEWSTLLFVVVLGVIIFSIIFVLYRRHMKRKISFEMQSRVDDMVSKYIEFYSERSGRK